jgi:serine/threonine-protein kinase
LAGAETTLREATELVRQNVSAENRWRARPAFTLAVVLYQRGHRKDAADLLVETLSTFWKTWPDGQSNVFAALGAFADAELSDRIRRPAEAVLQEVVTQRRLARGSEHPSVADAISLLGALRYGREAFVEAEADFREALAIRKKTLGPEDRAVAQSLFSIAVTLRRQGRPAEAEPLLGQALAIDRHNTKRPDAEELWAVNQLGRVQLELGHLDAAEASFREGLATATNIDAPKHEDQADGFDGLGVVLARRGDFAGAENALRNAYRFGQFRANGESLRNVELPRQITEHLIQLYGDWSKVDPPRAAAAEPLKKRLPDLAKVEAAMKKPFPLPPETPMPAVPTAP